MKEFKGTRDRWIAIEDATGHCVFTERGLICRTHNKPNKEEAEANTQLIAAALDMLETLISIIEDFGNTGEDALAMKEMAKEAINKALGEKL